MRGAVKHRRQESVSAVIKIGRPKVANTRLITTTPGLLVRRDAPEAMGKGVSLTTPEMTPKD
jgi:hypothetical protein